MGEDRREFENEKIKEIHNGLIFDYNINKRELFDCWKLFIKYIAEGNKYNEAYMKLKNNKKISKEIFDFFASFGLIVITKHVGNSLGNFFDDNMSN